MGRDALDADRGAACIEGFVDHFAELAAVDRVGEVDGELREVDLLGAEKADLLVGDEGDVDVAVRAVFLHDDVEGRHDVGDGRLVVRTEHRGAVGDDDVVAHVLLDFRMLGRAHPQVLFLVQADVAALIAADHLRMDVGAEAGIHSVEMAAPADRRNGLVVGKIARKQCRQHAVFGNLNVDEAEFGKFFGEHAGELALAFGARDDACLPVALARDGHIAQESFKNGFLHDVFSPQRGFSACGWRPASGGAPCCPDGGHGSCRRPDADQRSCY